MASTTAIKTSPPASNRPEEAAGLTQWKIYETIMTPINLITFIISLYLVDNRYQEQRARGHHQHHHQSRDYLSKIVPTWLHALLFRRQPQLQPYEWVGSSSSFAAASTSTSTTITTTTTSSSSSSSTTITTTTGTPKRRPAPSPSGAGRGDGGERWYYHTQQRRLLRMEAADALELRGAVLLGLGAAALGAAALACWLGALLAGAVRRGGGGGGGGGF